MAFLQRAANRKLVEQFVYQSESLSGNQFRRILSLFPGPMNRVVLNKLYALKPKVPTVQLPSVFYTIASRQLDSSLPDFLLQQLETSDEVDKLLFTPGQDCLVLYSLAKLSESAGDNSVLFDRIAQGLMKKQLSALTGKELGLALWALAQKQSPSSLGEALTRELISRNFQTFSGTDFAKSVYSVHQLSSVLPAPVQQQLIAKATKFFFESDWKKLYSPQEFTAVLESIARQVPYSQHDRLWENVKTLLLETEVLPSWNNTFQQRAMDALKIAAPQLVPEIQDRIQFLQTLTGKSKLQLEAKAEWEAFFSMTKEDPDDHPDTNNELIQKYSAKKHGVEGIETRIAEWEHAIKRDLLPVPVGHLVDLGLELPKPVVEEEEKKNEPATETTTTA
ncbi:hypothetical protein BASA81_003215 [Batrachochytrium salamandrivorans]|nr:hypothetical protein BASA81_003215 [Batrachochytrium salamandrivorans]